MATQLARKMGRSVIAILPVRVDLRLRAGRGSLKHQAAVFPANQKKRNPIPANIVDECPDGNDLWPSATTLSFLNGNI